jgi:tRNA A37 threonylcarbamoyladenosine biosynthesis protein TsaE
MILDIEDDKVHPIILGRPFLTTSRAVIDMDLEKLTLRREEKELVIKIHTKGDDKCFKLEWKEKKTNVPPTPTLRLKIEIEELEEDMAQLQIDAGRVKEEPHELTNQLQRLAIEVDIKTPWVKA